MLLPCHLGACLAVAPAAAAAGCLRSHGLHTRTHGTPNHSPAVLRHIALSLTVGWFSLLPRPRGISLESRDLFRPILFYCVILCCVRGYRRRGSLPPLLALDCPSCWPFGQALVRPFVCTRVVVFYNCLGRFWLIAKAASIPLCTSRSTTPYSRDTDRHLTRRQTRTDTMACTQWHALALAVAAILTDRHLTRRQTRTSTYALASETLLKHMGNNNNNNNNRAARGKMPGKWATSP